VTRGDVAATQLVRVGLTSFCDYVNLSGPGRVALMGQQVERFTDPTRLAWHPYQVAERACRDALASSDPRPILNQMVADAPINMVKHYPVLRDGLLKVIKTHRPARVLPVASAVWSTGQLRVKVNHAVGLQLPDQRIVLAFFYFKQQRITTAGARAALRIMEYKVSDILPRSIPAVMDVRRGKLLYMPRNIDRVKADQWLKGEAAGYASHWHASVA
jgi:hypothetical protein